MPGGHLVHEFSGGGVTLQVAVEQVQGEEIPQVPAGDAPSAAQGADIQDGEYGVHGCQEDAAQLPLLPNVVIWGRGMWTRGVGSPPGSPGAGPAGPLGPWLGAADVSQAVGRFQRQPALV